MNLHFSRMMFICVFFSLVSWAFVAGGQYQDNYVPGEVIVKLSKTANPDDALSIRSAINASVARQFKSIGAELWTLENTTVPDAIELVQGDPRIEYIEPNYIVTADDVFPNDPRFPEMWGLHNIGQTGGTPDADIDAPEAWSIETGDSVLVGVIDTGVDWHHVDLADNIYTNPGEIPGNGIDDDGNGYIDDVRGWDFVNNDNDPYDDAGHGTHVAGTVAAIGNNGIGVVGVSWSAKILPIKFLSSGGSGSTANAILSVEYATLMNVQLTNNSWGGGGFSTPLRDAIEAAGDQGILFLAAAGNSGQNADTYPHYPSSYDLDNIISVANTTHNDVLSGLSNYGAVSVDLAAPGSSILSTFPGNSYGSISGTSMATPHVSGAVSLLWSAAPGMSHLEVKDVIMSSVDVLPALVGRTVTGGRLNVFNMMSGLDSIPPARVGDLAVETMGSNTATLTWTATGDDSTDGTASTYDLRYSTSQIYWSNFDAATPVPGMPSPQPSGSPESFMVTGLDFTTTYYFAMVVVDEQDNRSWISNILVSGTTLGIPALEYAPMSFADSLYTGGNSTHVLTITNTGEGTLDFVFPGADWMGPGAFPSWLGADPPSGRVWAGESLEVQFALDATGLYGGAYAALAELTTNDPANTSTGIPFNLHVTNAPDIAVSPDAMDYGDLYLGLTKTDTIIVTNIGTDVLTVSSLGIDDPQFTVAPAGFTLGLGASRAVPVTFVPTVAGPIAGILSIASDDPDHPTLAVALNGQGVEPPIITVTPSSLSDDLFTGGLSTHTLNIGNIGGSQLDFELSLEDPNGAMNSVDVIADVSLPGDVIKAGRPLDADELAALKDKFPQSVSVDASGAIDKNTASVRRSGKPMDIERVEQPMSLEEIFGSDENQFNAGPRSRGNLFTCTTSSKLIEHRLYLNPSGTTQMWFLVYEGATQAGTYDLVSASDVSPAGPGLGWYSSGDINVPLEEGRYYLIVASFEQVTSYFNQQSISPYPIPASFGELTAGAGWDWAPPADFPPAPFVDVPSNAFGEPVAYYQTLVTGSSVRWLSLVPEEGSVPAMSSMDIDVTFNAEGLNGGDYVAEIIIANNDPFNSEVVVPVDLHVTGAPDIEVSETFIDYGQVFIGAHIPHTLTVTNAGTDALMVSSVASNHPDYTVDVTNFTLVPGMTQDVIVTFAPTTVAVIPGTLTLSSNDPDEPAFEIELQGAGLEPPIISVTPASLSDSLFTGETSIHSLNIANTGGSNLKFDLNTRENDAMGASAVVRKSINVPPSNGDFPLGTYSPSAGPAPQDGQPVGQTAPSTAAPAAMIGSAFATESDNLQATRFNLYVPEVLNFVGPAPDFVWAGDFGPRDNAFAYAIDGANQFVRIDTLDGSQTILGTMTPFGGENWSGMALDPTDGTMYAASTNVGTSSLYVIDVEAAALTRVGPIGQPGIISLAVDTDGNMFAHDIVTDELVSIDKTTGTGTTIGSLGFDANFGQGMAYDPVTEALYLAAFNNFDFRAELRIADRTTGATALVGVLGSATPGGTVQLGWLGIPGLGGVRWLSLDPNSGIVPPGTSLDVEVVFDAAGLFGGDYLADIVVANNDPLNPEVAVPASLNVTGAPDIDVSETLIDYGPVFIGAVIPDTLVVTNVGTDALIVSGISSSHADFTTDVTNFALAPLTSQNVVVTFAPTTAAPIVGTLTLTSDDPDQPAVQVELLGEGLVPPVIGVNPDSLSDSLFTGGTSTQTLTINNTGGSDLTFDLSILEPEASPPSSAAAASNEIPYLDLEKNEPDPRVGPPVTQASGGPDAFGYRWTDSDEPGGPAFNWVDISSVGTPLFLGDDGSQSVPLPFVFPFYGVEQTNVLISANGYVTFGTYGSSYSNQPIPNPNIPNDIIAAFWSDLYPGGGGPVYYYHDAPGNRFIVQYQDVPHLGGGGPYTFEVILNENGSILIQYLTMNSGTSASTTGIENAAGTDGLQVAFNTNYVHDNLALRISTTPAWLSVDPESGTVPAGMSMDVEVAFDAADLIGGDYAAEIAIANNDPLTPEVTVPAGLHVTGAPDIAVSDTLLDYGSIFVGAEVKDTLIVTNSGTDALVVSDVSAGHGDYAVNPTFFTLNPGENQAVEVALTPSSTGALNSVLTLTSNDPDEGTLIVDLHGEGVDPPIIGITPDSLADSLFTGDMSTHTLTVTNTGSSDLVFGVALQSIMAANSPVLEPGAVAAPSAGNYNRAPGTIPHDPIMVDQGPTPNDTDPTTDPIEIEAEYAGTYLHFGISEFGEIMPFQYPIATEHLRLGTYVSGYTLAYRVGSSDYIAYAAFTIRGSITPVSYTELVNNPNQVVVEVVTQTSDGRLTITRVFTFVRNDKFIGIRTTLENTSGDTLGDVVFKSYADWDVDGGASNDNWDYSQAVSMVYAWENHFTGIGSDRVPDLMDIDGWDDYLSRQTTVGVPVGPVYGYDGLEVMHYEMGDLDDGGSLEIATAFAAGDDLADLEGAILRGLRNWLAIDPTDGVVPPGGSMDIEVVFDATGLDGDDYATDILFASNDPLNPEVTVPVDMHVTGASNIAVSDSLVNFGAIFVGATIDRQITVSNTGNDDLIVYGIASTHSDVSANPASFTVPQNGNVTVTVTYAPILAGVVSDSLTIVSNDPDEPEVVILTMGEGLVPPDVAVTPESLSEALLSGETSSQTLTIANPGGSTLEYWIWIGPTADSAAVATSSSNQLPGGRDQSLPGFATGQPPALSLETTKIPVPVDPSASFVPGSGAARDQLTDAAAQTQQEELLVTWLSVTPTSGTVNAGDDVSITVDFDAAGLLGGLYDAVLAVTTNVPSKPQVDVPVSLDVTGVPVIAVSDTLLDFGVVYVGHPKTKTLTVRNTGTDELEVSEITADDPTFSVTPGAFTLSPAQAVSVFVTQTPATSGAVTAVLSITSNDPANGVAEVDLTAEILEPPVLSVAPDSIVVSLSPTEIHTDTLILTNSGGSDLVWNVSTSSPVAVMGPSASNGSGAAPVSNRGGGPQSLESLATLNILWHGNHGLGDIILWSIIVSDLTSRGATVTQSTDPITNGLLAGVDIVWFGDRDVAFTASEISALGDWLTAGGSILVEADSDPSRAVYNELLETIGSGIFYWLAVGLGGDTPNVYPHETTAGVETIHLLGPGKILGFQFPSAGPLVDDLTGHPVVAYDQVGDGRIVVMADHIFHDVAINIADNRLFANQVFNWFGALDWLNIAPTSGTLGMGGTEELEITIDATVLLPGSYQRNIDIASNDPANPVITIPVHLAVDSTETATGITEDRVPTRYVLHPNYPNPFNPTTTIAYDLPERTGVKLVIYDVGGREVRRLVGETQPYGHYEVTWDGRNASGDPAASGVYFYKLAAGEFVQTRKMILLK